jgi:hypothetical protein
MSIQTKRTSTLYGVLPGWVRAQSFCKIWLISRGFSDLRTKISAYQMRLEFCMQNRASGPDDELFAMKTILNQYTNFRTFQTKYPAAPCPLLPTSDAQRRR